MIGALPKRLTVNGVKYLINTDYRVALLIFEAYADPELSDAEKAAVCMQCLYHNVAEIPESVIGEAYEQAVWFLDGGEDYKVQPAQKKLMDWQQDEKMIFAAVNKAAGQEVRAVQHMHWWTFLGLFREVGECTFNIVISIRDKRNKGKRLEKHEQEFYRMNKDIVDIKTKYSVEEQMEIDEINRILGE